MELCYDGRNYDTNYLPFCKLEKGVSKASKRCNRFSARKNKR